MSGFTAATALQTAGSFGGTDRQPSKAGGGSLLDQLAGGVVPGIGPGFTGSSSATSGDVSNTGGDITFGGSGSGSTVALIVAGLALVALLAMRKR